MAMPTREVIPRLKLDKAPIVEAVLDIDCDLPPGREITKLEEAAREKLGDIEGWPWSDDPELQKAEQKALASLLSQRAERLIFEHLR